MSGKIPQPFIDDLLARTDIVDLIDGYVPLRKAGKNHQARCPFHDDRSPSFTVSQDKQFYHCFGCGANGTAIGFLMEYSHLGFVDAIEELAARAGLEVPREGGGAPAGRQQQGITELYELMELLVPFYQRQLREHPQAERAVAYLKQRGISGRVAAEYELGFAPPGWDNLLGELGKSAQARTRLERIGMIVARSGGHYDRFRDRIMFPIRDQRGRAIGFGGRVIDAGNPKYLNSPETPIFHKGRELYGLYRALRREREPDCLYVVEGYMDVLALAEYGIGNAVASLGTAATTEHVEKLFRASGRIVFCFDGDEAGSRAAWRAMETCLPALHDGRQVFFRFLPEGQDPDDFIRDRGTEAFADPGARVALSDYFLQELKRHNDLGSREGRSRLLDQAAPHLSRLPFGALRQLLFRDLASVAGSSAEDIESLVTRGSRGRRPQPRPRPAGPGRMTLIGHVIALLLHRPALATLIAEPESLDQVPVAGTAFLRELVEFIHARPQISTAGILEHWRGSRYEDRLRQLATGSDSILVELHDLEAELLDALERLEREKQKHLQKKSTTVNRMSDLSDDKKAELRALFNHPNVTPEK